MNIVIENRTKSYKIRQEVPKHIAREIYDISVRLKKPMAEVVLDIIVEYLERTSLWAQGVESGN